MRAFPIPLTCVVLVGVAACCARKRPEPIEVLASDGGIMRPPPDVRARFDGTWTGKSGDRTIELDLVDGLGYCDAPGSRNTVIMLTSFLENGHGEWVLQTEAGATFYWFSQSAEDGGIVVSRIARWQDDPGAVWPVVPFVLRRE